MTARIVFAWSGGADAWANIAATAKARAAEIVTLTLDLGQGADLEEVRDRALASGAIRAHVLDVPAQRLAARRARGQMPAHLGVFDPVEALRSE